MWWVRCGGCGVEGVGWRGGEWWHTISMSGMSMSTALASLMASTKPARSRTSCPTLFCFTRSLPSTLVGTLDGGRAARRPALDEKAAEHDGGSPTLALVPATGGASLCAAAFTAQREI